MLSAPDFAKKQIAFVFFNEGEKISFSNDNIVIKDASGRIKFQCTCYRLFIVFAIGGASFTTGIIQNAQKFGYFLVLMTPGFRVYSLIGAQKEGNTLLHKRQYEYDKIDLAKHITKNKMQNQMVMIKNIRSKMPFQSEGIKYMERYIEDSQSAETISELMAYEGLTSKIYFKCLFDNVDWKGRQPRIKRDYVNSTLDIGYTLLFNFVDALLSSFGFDTYYGVMHQQFYMRKSLVCDIVEPFRPLIDYEIKKEINLKQIQERDFMVCNHQYKLQWKESPKYVKNLMKPLMDNKESIFYFVQSYYRAFMKGLPTSKFPTFEIGE